jgi:hypothetical protein
LNSNSNYKDSGPSNNGSGNSDNFNDSINLDNSDNSDNSANNSPKHPTSFPPFSPLDRPTLTQPMFAPSQSSLPPTSGLVVIPTAPSSTLAIQAATDVSSPFYVARAW